MNIGLLPVTGTTVPFLSYGGSHLFTEFLGLAIVMAMALALVSAGTAAADGESINFESYTTGSINGQDGWSATGARSSGSSPRR